MLGKNLTIKSGTQNFDGCAEMLQDMVIAAVNGALKMADDETSKAMNKLQGGLGGFPGMF